MKTFIFFTLLFPILFLLTSCMHVKSLAGDTLVASQGLSLNFNRLSNSGGGDFDRFESVIESGDYYIAVGYSVSDLSGLTGGSTNTGGRDFVIAKIDKSDLSLFTINNLGGTAFDFFYSVIESGDYYIAVGYTMSDLSGLTGGSAWQGGYDFVIAKFNKSDLSLVTVNNFGTINFDDFQSVIESDSYYIAVGSSSSDLSGFTGGSANTGVSDFVIAKFN